MGDQNKNVPRLRFPGYTDAWVKCTLGDLANFRRGSFPQPYGNDEWYDDIYGMPFVQVVDVDKNMQLVPTTKQRISKLAIPKSVFVSKGKIVVTLQGSIGRVAITQYDSYVDRTLLIFESYTNPVDEYFFAQVIQQLFEVEKERAPGGTIKTITKATLTNFQILLPKCEEQHKIGEFFKHLDNLITVNEHKQNKRFSPAITRIFYIIKIF